MKLTRFAMLGASVGLLVIANATGRSEFVSAVQSPDVADKSTLVDRIGAQQPEVADRYAKYRYWRSGSDYLPKAPL